MDKDGKQLPRHTARGSAPPATDVHCGGCPAVCGGGHPQPHRAPAQGAGQAGLRRVRRRRVGWSSPGSVDNSGGS